MALYQNDVLENMIEYLGMDELEEDGYNEPNILQNSVDDQGDDGDAEVLEDQGNKKTDTSAFEARNGKDIQGIPWERMTYTRSQYRETRLKKYNNYVSLLYSRDALKRESKELQKGSIFYDFQYNTRVMKSTIVHFQLRNLVWATSKHDVYCMHNSSVMHWSSLSRNAKEVLNVYGKIVPEVKSRSKTQALSRVQVCTLCVKDDLLVAGGFQGELVCKHVNRPGVDFCTKLPNDENAITNAVDIYNSPNGSTRLITASNDCYVRLFDVENYALLGEYPFPWSVNNTSVSPDGRIVAVLGDDTDCVLADALSGKTVACLRGHLDYNFSSAWHPDGLVLATGNQDTTCRLWDLRNPSASFSVLQGRMAAIRTIKYTSDGRFLAMAEPADFVHIFDVKTGYGNTQEIDIFGEISGISFSPDTEALFIGVADRTYGSLLELSRRHQYWYLDTCP